MSPTEGSSPLTRGKPHSSALDAHGQRLIPAHAGKTVQPIGCRSRHTAHPRSRGENFNQSFRVSAGAGSSPLTRGKLSCMNSIGVCTRLIPAHAGKTVAAPPR